MSDTRSTRSTTGIIFTMFGGAISWQSRLRPTIPRSRYEAENMAASPGCQEALWLRKFLRDVGHASSSPAVLYGDNKAALVLLHNVDMMSSRVSTLVIYIMLAKSKSSLGMCLIVL